MFRSSFVKGLAILACGKLPLLGVCALMLTVPTMVAYAAPPSSWITTMYNSANNQESGATIKVQVATTGTYWSKNGWGGTISGLYYRPGGSGSWGSNLIDNTDVGQLLQVALYEGPPSEYFSSSGLSNWPWNLTQGGDAYGYTAPAYITGSGLSPTPWVSIRTWPYDWANTHHECVQLDQTVLMYPNHVEVSYSVSGRSGYSCSHPVMFQEGPVLYTSRYLSTPLKDGKYYSGSSPWTGDSTLTTVDTDTNWHQVYPSEDWIGLYATGGGSGLTLAYPQRTRYQPYCHHWSFYQSEYDNDQLRTRPFFDTNPGTGETISWSVYVIPGTPEVARANAYCLLPHDNWGFGLSHEGWIAGNQISNLRAESGKLKGTSTGSDPYMYSLDQLGFASDSIYGIRVRMAITVPPGTSQARKAQVFYTTEESQTFSEDKSTGQRNITADGQFRTYTWQLDNITGWDGKTLKRLRLDPCDCATTTDGIRINYMKLIRYVGRWGFNASGNNEGWMPVTKQLKDRIWPGNVANGSLIVDSSGSVTDTYTDPDTTIYPALRSPYPLSLSGTTGYRYVEVKLKLVGSGTYNARLRYTLDSDEKEFEYHGESPEWPDYFHVTRFDVADHSPIWQTNIPSNQWVVLTFTLPSTGTIDQLELVPTDKSGTVYIDYITVEYV